MTRPRIVLAGRIGRAALPDDLVLAGMVRIAADADAAIVAVSADPEHTVRTHGIPAVPADVPTLVAATMESADLVLFGGVRPLSDREGATALTRELSQVCLARGVGVPILPFGLAIGDVGTKVGEGVCRAVLPMMSPGLLRDEESARRLVALGGPESSTAPDLVFGLAPPLIRGEDRIVACLHPVADEDEESFVRAMAKALAEASERTGLPVCFVAMQAGRDDRIHRRVAERMIATTTTLVIADLPGFLPELGRARVVVSMHHLGIVGAILGGRPSVRVHEDGQTDRLAAEVGSRVVGATTSTVFGVGAIPGLVSDVLGQDAAAIDVREEIRGRLIRARSLIERALHTV